MANEPSKVGKKLTELTTRRVIILVLLMIVCLPLLDGTLTADNYNQYQDAGLNQLHKMTSDSFLPQKCLRGPKGQSARWYFP